VCEPVNKNQNSKIHITTRITGCVFVWVYIDLCDSESITDLVRFVQCHALTPCFQKCDTILTEFHVHPVPTMNDKHI